MNEPQCTATRKDGRPCDLPALPSADVCFAHGATRTTKAKGGRNSSKVIRGSKHLPEHLKLMERKLLVIVAQLGEGKLAPRPALAMIAAIGKLLDLARFSYEVGEAAELKRRLDALEAQIGTSSRRAG